MTATVDNRRREREPGRTYTREAVAALVKASQDILDFGSGPKNDRLALRAALRPFTTEPSSWAAFCRELWGENWADGPQVINMDGRRVSAEEIERARAAYRARYGVEPQ